MESMNKKAKQTPPPPSPTADQDGGSAGGGADRISALDDDLLELILRLAHLNVRELVRTSVLSKRWRGLWKRLPVLDFFFWWPVLKSVGDVQQYIAIVNDVLEQRAGATSEARIHEVKFPLLLEAHSLRGQRQQLLTLAMEAAKAWIQYAMHHQVKGLQLNLRLPPVANKERRTLKKPEMDLEELLPSFPKLECMRLGLSRHTKVRLPRTAVFTSLKDLTLEFVELAAGSGHLLAQLLSAVCCPSLQKLRMKCVNFDRTGIKELVLDAGELLELSIEGVIDMELLELRTPKLLYLEIKECEYVESLRVSAPRLKELTYFDNSDFTIVHGHLPCVQRLKIDLFAHMGKEDGDDDEEDPNSTNICLLKLCSASVRCLVVHLYVPLENVRCVDLIKNKIPQLPSVTSLLVSIDVECQRHSFGDSVAGLLRSFKNLEYLSLRLDDSPDICHKKDEYYSEDADVDSSFTCNHSENWKSSDISFANLRKAEFRGMTGTGCELRFLRFVLAKATDLQSVTVSFNLYFIEEEDEEEGEEEEEEEEEGEEEEAEEGEEEEEGGEEEEGEEEEHSRICYFLHMLLGDGTWTACEDEDFDKKYYFSKLYKWTPSP